MGLNKLIRTNTILAFVIALSGCAAIEKSNAVDTERMLSASGFRMKFADTPEKLAHLQSLTQSKLVAHEKDGVLYYLYADAEFCKCLYVGNEKAYQEYQQLLIRRNIADMNEQTAIMNQDAAMNWGMWGEWGPWY